MGGCYLFFPVPTVILSAINIYKAYLNGFFFLSHTQFSTLLNLNKQGWFKGVVPRIGLGIWQTLFMVTGARMVKDYLTEEPQKVVEPVVVAEVPSATSA